MTDKEDMIDGEWYWSIDNTTQIAIIDLDYTNTVGKWCKFIKKGTVDGT